MTTLKILVAAYAVVGFVLACKEAFKTIKVIRTEGADVAYRKAFGREFWHTFGSEDSYLDLLGPPMCMFAFWPFFLCDRFAVRHS